MTEATKLRIDLPNIPMSELWEIKKKIGRSVLVEFQTKGAAAFDEEMATALVWIDRRKENPDLTFEDVFSTLTLKQLGEVEIKFDDNPPAKAASSAIAPKSSRRSRGSTGQARQEPSTP